MPDRDVDIEDEEPDIKAVIEAPEDDEVEAIVEAYHDYEIETPFTHPFTALKSHNIQFGSTTGFMLGLLAYSDVAIDVNLLISTVTLDSVSASVLVMLMVAFYAIGINRAGPIEAAETDDAAVGVAQIRRKPHYFVTPMVITWSITYGGLLLASHAYIGWVVVP